MVDPPGSRKETLDRLLGRPLRRWAVRQALLEPAHRHAAGHHRAAAGAARAHRAGELGRERGSLPARSARQRGAAELAALRRRYGMPEDAVVAAFVGSFRAWHGVGGFVRAALAPDPATIPHLYFLAVGGGPELEPVRALARRPGRRRPRAGSSSRGPQPHTQVPPLLALADMGVAPVCARRLSAAARLRLLLVATQGLRVHGDGPAGGHPGHPAA